MAAQRPLTRWPGRRLVQRHLRRAAAGSGQPARGPGRESIPRVGLSARGRHAPRPGPATSARSSNAKAPRASRRCPASGPASRARCVEMWRTGRWVQLERLRGSADPVQLLHAAARPRAPAGRADPRRTAGRHAGGTRDRGARRAARERGRRRPAAAGGHPGQPAGHAGARPGTARPPAAGPAARASRPGGYGRAFGRRRCWPWTASTARRRRRASCPRSRRSASTRRARPGCRCCTPTRDGWHYTALYSNTALAHQLDRTRDWVVLFFYDDDHVEGQHTIVTETHGPLAGRRVVRGREAECGAHYAE